MGWICTINLTCCGSVASPSRSAKKSGLAAGSPYRVARFAAFFSMRRAMYSLSDCCLVAARASYMARFLNESLAILRSTVADFLFDDFFAFLVAVDVTSSSRLRLLFLSNIFAGASLSDADVGGVLAPEGGADASVALAELSSIVPAMASPFTKKPYKPPRLIPLVRIWLSVLCRKVSLQALVLPQAHLHLLSSSNALQTIIESAHPPLVVCCPRRLLLPES